MIVLLSFYNVDNELAENVKHPETGDLPNKAWSLLAMLFFLCHEWYKVESEKYNMIAVDI